MKKNHPLDKDFLPEVCGYTSEDIESMIEDNLNTSTQSIQTFDRIVFESKKIKGDIVNEYYFAYKILFHELPVQAIGHLILLLETQLRLLNFYIKLNKGYYFSSPKWTPGEIQENYQTIFKEIFRPEKEFRNLVKCESRLYQHSLEKPFSEIETRFLNKIYQEYRNALFHTDLNEQSKNLQSDYLQVDINETPQAINNFVKELPQIFHKVASQEPVMHKVPKSVKIQTDIKDPLQNNPDFPELYDGVKKSCSKFLQDNIEKIEKIIRKIENYKLENFNKIYPFYK